MACPCAYRADLTRAGTLRAGRRLVATAGRSGASGTHWASPACSGAMSFPIAMRYRPTPDTGTGITPHIAAVAGCSVIRIAAGRQSVRPTPASCACSQMRARQEPAPTEYAWDSEALWYPTTPATEQPAYISGNRDGLTRSDRMRTTDVGTAAGCGAYTVPTPLRRLVRELWEALPGSLRAGARP